MGTARRLYVYIVSAVSLFALTAGIASLLTTIFRELTGNSVLVGGGVSREQLSLAIALIAVGGPTWALHWWLARRGLRAPGARGEEERASGVRAWYVALVQAVALACSLVALVGLLSTLLLRVFGVAGEQTWYEGLAITMVAVPVWAVFARTRALEIRATRMTGPAAWFTRLYRYGGAFACLAILVFAASALTSTLLSILVGRADFGLDDPWWRMAAAGQLAGFVVGLGAWLLHWREADLAIRDAALIGEDDRLTRLRATYFGAVLLVMASFGAFMIAGALADLGRWLMGVNDGDTLAFLEQVAGPPLTAVPVVIAGAWHAWYASREAVGLGEEQALSTRRNGLLLVSLVGLAFLAAGGIQLIELALVRVASSTVSVLVPEAGSQRQLPWYLSQLIVGAVLWLPAWAGILSLRARDLARERAAPVTRAHLFLVVGASIVAAVPTATMTLYRVLDTILGGRPTQPLLLDLAFPIAVVIVALIGGVYHGWLLLGDIRASAAEAVETPALAQQVEPKTIGVPSVPAELELELTVHAPAGTDMTALVAGLRDHVPAGVTLEEHNGGRRGVPAGVA